MARLALEAWRARPSAKRKSSWGSRKTAGSGDAHEGSEIVTRLASTPRFAGSPEETEARHWCARKLTDAGFAASEETFEYSTLPAKIVLPLVSVLLGTLAVLVAHLAIGHAMPGIALAIAVAGGIVTALVARYLTGRATLDFPWGRATGTNLVGSRPGDAPKIWLVAHLDTKSQAIPMLVRIVGLSALVVFYGLLIAAVGALALVSEGILSSGIEDLHHRLVHAVGNLAHLVAFSALPLMIGFTGNKSPGALDNATGIATVLLALRRIGRRDVAILFTSAEELGLAGARAFVKGNRKPAVAINCDTIDDAGDFICMASGRRSRRLDAAIDRAAREAGIDTRRPSGSGFARLRRMLPGVLADNIAFTDAGWESFTLSRGNLGTLGRVHTSRDRADPIDGTGIALAALLIAGTVEETT